MHAELRVLLDSEVAIIRESMGSGSNTSVVTLTPLKGSLRFSAKLEAKIMAMQDECGDPIWKISPGPNASYAYQIVTLSEKSLLLNIIKKMENSGISVEQVE